MRHGRKTKKLGRKKEHRRALLRNMARSLFIYGQIRTTWAKAKAAQGFVERLIGYAKAGSLASHRILFSYLSDHELVKTVVEKIAPLFANRLGGYTRIYHLGPRIGDGAEMALFALVERPAAEIKDKKKEEKKEIKKPETKVLKKKEDEKAKEKKGEAEKKQEKIEKKKEEAKKKEGPKKKEGKKKEEVKKKASTDNKK